MRGIQVTEIMSLKGGLGLGIFLTSSVYFGFEAGSYVALAVVKDDSELRSCCFYLCGAGFIGVRHHTW